MTFGAAGSGRPLAQLEWAGLIDLEQSGLDEEYAFHHVLVQEAVYSALVKTDRRRLHQAVAEAIESIYPQHLAAYAPLLAYHFDQSGDVRRALDYYVRAGDAACQVYANSEAVGHYTRALELLERRQAGGLAEDLSPLRLHVYGQRGRSLELWGMHVEAIANYAEQVTRGRALGDNALVLAGLLAQATLYSTPTPVFDVAKAEATCDEALALARELGDYAAEAKTLWDLLLVNYFAGPWEKALAYGEASLAIARQHNLREQMAFTLNDLGAAFFEAGDVERGIQCRTEAGQLFRELGNLPMVTDYLAGTAEYLVGMGRYDEGLERSREAYDLSQKIGNIWGQSYALMARFFIYAEWGEIDTALATAQESVRLARQAGFRFPVLLMSSVMSIVYVELGAVEEALAAALAPAAMTPNEMLLDRGFMAAARAQVHLLAGDIASARASVAEINFDRVGLNPLAVSLTYLAAARVAFAVGDLQRAGEVIDRGLDIYRRTNVLAYLPDMLLMRARVWLASGEPERAGEALEQARAAAEAVRSGRSLWMILAELANLEPDAASAAEMRRQAREIVAFISEHLDSEHVRACFLALPAVESLNAE